MMSYRSWMMERKRAAQSQWHIEESNPTSKKRSKHNARLARQRKRFSSNHPRALNPPWAAQCSGYAANICYSDDSSNEITAILAKSKCPKPTAHSIHSHMHKRKRNRSNVDDDEERIRGRGYL
ncbi:hypothetical protein GQ44DRAFT_148026 [Phaeosphaeriaceae sp. PMI808]|nr:hypothetical protein GQ44DRAFT_148026 [Phaeosphaeriaceae sp. PMI808]